MLVSKERAHRLAREVVTRRELQDALTFFVIAFVVYPLLPDRPLGPFGAVNPSRVWLLVVLLSGVSGVGYLAVRLFGARRLPLAGLPGGFVSLRPGWPLATNTITKPIFAFGGGGASFGLRFIGLLVPPVTAFGASVLLQPR